MQAIVLAAAPYLLPLLIEAFKWGATKIGTSPEQKAAYEASAADLERANDRVQAAELPPPGSGR